MHRWILLISLAITFVLPAAAPYKSSLPTLSVSGCAAISAPADLLQLNIGVITQGKSAEEALDANSAHMDSLIQALVKAGLEKKEYQTGRFSIYPLYSHRPKDAPPDWSAKIVGFEVNNALAVSTKKINEAGNFIDTAVKAGANNINSIAFQVSAPQKHRNALIRTATKNAFEDAASLSQEAGVKLLQVLSISVDDPQNLKRPQFLMKTAAAPSVSIAAGNVEMSVCVTVVYQIH